MAARKAGAKRSTRRSERWRAESLESRTLLAALVSLNSSSPSLAENGGTAVVTATLNEPQDHDVFVNLNLGGTAGNNVGYRATTSAAPITVDGNFSDWRNNPNVIFRTDGFNDTHDTDTGGEFNTPAYVNHPDVDLVEFGVTHDDNNVYFYFRSTGVIGRTQVPSPGKNAGRYYAIVTMDVDNNDVTGYPLHEGGYYPTSNGYDMNSEIEYYGGEFNTGNYLNHGATDMASLNQAFAQQSQGGFNPNLDKWDIQGPFAPGYVNILPGTYDYYTQWVYKDNDPARGGNDSVTFVKDKGPIVEGIIKQVVSADGHEMEMIVPYKGFLKDAQGNPIVDVGKILDLSFSLEASGELAPGGQWASDTANPINGYQLTASSAIPVNMIRIPAGQTSASLTLTGIADGSFNPSRTAAIEVSSVVGATENGSQAVTLEVQNDDSPSLSTTPTVLEYAANSPAAVIDAGVNSVDPSGSLYSSATVSISSGFVAGQDSLLFTNQSGITGIYNSSTGVLTLTGSATVANYLAALRSIKFQNAGSSTGVVNKTVTFQVSGGGLSASASRGIKVISLNAGPVISLFDSTTYYKVATAPVLLDPDVMITDADSANFDGGVLTVQLVDNVEDSDMLEIRSLGTATKGLRLNLSDILYDGVVIGSFTGGKNSLPLVISLNSAATPAITQVLLRNITYRSASGTPSLLPRSVRVTLTDGDGGASLPVSKALQLAISNIPPSIGAFDTTVKYTENAAAVLIDSNATVIDSDSANFDGGTVSVAISSNALASDRLEIRNVGTGAGQIGVSGASVLYAGTVIGSFSGGNGAFPLVVSLNSNATVAAAQALLRNVTYRNDSDNPGTLTRTVRVTMNDGDGGTSEAVSKLIEVIARNDSPVIDGFDTTVSYTEGSAGVLVDNNANVSDVDSSNFEGGRLVAQLITNGQSTDRLEIRHQGTGAGQIGVDGTTVLYGGVSIGTFTGGVGAGALTVTLNAGATPQAVQALLRNITFRNISDNPKDLVRTLRVSVTDGDGGTSAQVTKSIQVTSVNDAPVIGAFDTAVAYKAKAAAVLLDTNATVIDPDSLNLDGGKLTVRLSANAQADDRLEIRNVGTAAGQIGVSGSNVTYGGVVIGTFTGGAGATSLVITLNTNATPVMAQGLLRNITYRSVSLTPSTLTRTVSVTLTDGDGGTSLVASKEILVSA
ncbi:MAG: hypothetical protein U0929_20515 [Planctomycetaceae bacterium]